MWDMDGTLVDTEPCWMAAETAIVTEFGGRWTHEDALQMIGLPLMTAARILAEHGVPLPHEEIARRLVDSVVTAVARELVWQPGARELLEQLRDAGVPCALVTMSYRVLAEAVVAQAPDGVFQVMVTGDEVERGKPHPEPYLRAAELLGVRAEDCVAVEDSPPGISSALAAGVHTLGVQHIVPVEQRPGLSRVATLEGVTLADLEGLVRGQVLDRLTGAAPG
nr:HAD family phosphatase [Cellulomonas sp. APG4]